MCVFASAQNATAPVAAARTRALNIASNATRNSTTTRAPAEVPTRYVALVTICSWFIIVVYDMRTHPQSAHVFRCFQPATEPVTRPARDLNKTSVLVNAERAMN